MDGAVLRHIGHAAGKPSLLGRFFPRCHHDRWASTNAEQVIYPIHVLPLFPGIDCRHWQLSRLAVLLVFPAFMLAVWIIKSVILFKRGSKIDKQVTGLLNNAIWCRSSPEMDLPALLLCRRSTR